MSHIRTQLRAALQSALTGLPTTGDRVSINRSAPVSAARTPCLLITTPREEIEQVGAMASPIIMRRITVVIEAAASGTDLDAQLDQIAVEVETAMAGIGMLNGMLKDAPRYTEAQIEHEDAASPPLGYLRLAYEFVVASATNNPASPL